MRILYVDDEDINLRVMRDVFALVLKRPGAVVTASNGDEALRLLRRETFDVVLSDQRMPGMSGTELLGRVREIAPATARMIVTGFTGDQEVREALRTGLAAAVVAKPWKPKELEGTIESILPK